MVIREIRAKSILTKSNIPGVDFCINPYVGCAHACLYCYARFMKRFTGHDEPWGEFVDVKVNAAALLRERLTTMRNPQGYVLVGSVTDPYQPLERKYELTRGIMRELAASPFDVTVLTKSDLVTRDVDVLADFERCTVEFSITGVDEEVAAALEPGAASPARRLAALRELHEAGVATRVFVSPILPGLTNLYAVFEAVRGFTGGISAETLNVSAADWPRLAAAFRKSFPDRFPAFRENARSPDYWDGVEAEFGRLCAELGVPASGFYRH
ncbi:MAG: radical SAM protein [candidate division Zixibacteria bacterium]|nr:radical SAM protein [candidate division Zixibacteria bacterium]